MSIQNTPGIYAKGEDRRLARSASVAVALVFDGFERVGDLPGETVEAEVTDTPSAQPEAVDPGTPAPSPSILSTRRKPSSASTETPEV